MLKDFFPNINKTIKVIIKKIISTSLVAGSLNFLSNILFLRHVDKYEYGLYIILIGVFALSNRLTLSVDNSVLRFQRNKWPEESYFLITSFLIKLFIYILVSLISYSTINTFPELLNLDKNDLFKKIIFFTIIFSCLDGVNSFLLNSARAKLKYSLIFKTNTITSFLFMVMILIITYIFNADIIFYIWATCIVALIQILSYGSTISLAKTKKIKKLLYLQYYFKNYFKKYTLPLTGNHFFAYLSKDHGPNIILGSFFGPEKIAALSIVRYIFDFFHNNVGNFMQKLIPVYHNFKNTLDTSILKKIFFLGNFFYLIIGFTVIFFKDFYLPFFKLEVNLFYSLILTILTLEFIFKFSNLYLTYSILLSKDTFALLIASIIRTIVTILFFLIGINLNDFFISIIGFGFGILSSAPILLVYSSPEKKFVEVNFIIIINLLCYIALFNYIFFKTN